MPLRNLSIWAGWALLVLTTYFLLYRDTEVWNYVEGDASHVTWLIMGLFTLGVAASFILAGLMAVEFLHAGKAQRQAQAGGLYAVQPGTSRQAVDRFFRSLISAVEARGQPDTEKLLSVELAAYGRVAHFIEVIGTLLITLGLVGTVLGLTLTLTGLTGSLDALGRDSQVLLDGLRQAMGGMSTAFYTTLLGAVLGGVLLRVFAQINQNGVEALYDSVMRICLIHCSADCRQSLERDVRLLNTELQTLDRQVQALQATFADSRDAMSGFRGEVVRLTQGVEGGEPLDDVIRKHREYCELLRQEMRLVYSLNRPWWVRFMQLLPVSRER